MGTREAKKELDEIWKEMARLRRGMVDMHHTMLGFLEEHSSLQNRISAIAERIHEISMEEDDDISCSD